MEAVSVHGYVCMYVWEIFEAKSECGWLVEVMSEYRRGVIYCYCLFLESVSIGLG